MYSTFALSLFLQATFLAGLGRYRLPNSAAPEVLEAKSTEGTKLVTLGWRAVGRQLCGARKLRPAPHPFWARDATSLPSITTPAHPIPQLRHAPSILQPSINKAAWNVPDTPLFPSSSSVAASSPIHAYNK